MATSPAPARSHMGKLHKKYELTDQVGKGCRLSVSGLVRRLSSAPRFCSRRESGWMEPQLEQTHPSLLPSSSVQPVAGTRACIPDTDGWSGERHRGRLTLSSCELCCTRLTTWPEAAWTFSGRNAETLVLQATHQLITMSFYQAYPHSINNAPGRSFI